MPDEDDAEARSAKLRELIELERRRGQLRTELGLTHEVAVPRVSASAEQAMHALIGEYASDFLSVHAGDGTYVWASPSCERMLGWTPAELIGRSAYDLFHPEDLARIAENHSRHVDEDDAGEIEYRLRRPDGNYCWVSTHSTNCKDEGGLPLIVCFTRDISKQRERQALLETLLAQRDQQATSDMLRVCAWCKRIGSPDSDEWQTLEHYLKQLTGRELTHGMCERCAHEFSEQAGLDEP